VQRFAAACVQQGYSPLEVGELGSATTAWLDDANLNGMLLTANDADAYDTGLPPLRTFYDALHRYAPQLLDSSLAVIHPNTLFAWAGGLLFQAAARAAHLTPASSPGQVKRGLYALKEETLGGVSPPLTFAPGRAAFVRCYFTDRMTGGRIIPLNDGRTTCLSLTQTAAIIDAVEH
jgi:branched-chain amino acid transport system substrate-binding protein